MRNLVAFLLLMLPFLGFSQTFTRTELPTTLATPWEIQYGADGFLWLSERNGTISRVDPETGDKTTVFVASDYFEGTSSENSPFCTNYSIGKGTLGLALHPDFLNPDNAYVYLMYSYNNGTEASSETLFKIKRLKWSHSNQSIVEDVDVVLEISNGYDHLGGRLLAVKQNGTPYLFVSVGDHGISEVNSPDCYNPQSLNPNNYTQDVDTDNGKIHRYNMDGSIPNDNPIAGNSFYTRGHRNPQGLMYNDQLGILYDVEHGDRTDDEINVLLKGMNYGWKDVRGYHDDDNHPGEASYIANYTPHPDVAGDQLVEAFYSFCDVELPTDPNNKIWCTIAPSDGTYYGSNAIPEWTNSLLITTLKNGDGTDMEVYQFKLDAQGELEPSTAQNPNPQRFFGEDQSENGRLRDIAISPDGKKIFLINNGGTDRDKITVYTVKGETSVTENEIAEVAIQPTVVQNHINFINLTYQEGYELEISNQLGQVLIKTSINPNQTQVDVLNLKGGAYYARIIDGNGVSVTRKFVKR